MTALAGSTKVMQQVNEDMDIKEISNIMKEFNKEMGKSEMN